jgi:putative endopeptidase
MDICHRKLDYDSYVNSTWYNKTELPKNKKSITQFDMISHQNKLDILQLLQTDKFHKKVYEKIYTDTNNIENIRKHIKKIMLSENLLFETISNNIFPFFNLEITSDIYEPRVYKIILSYNHLSMPDNSYYGDEKYNKRFLEFIQGIYRIYDEKITLEELKKTSKTIFDIERELSDSRLKNHEFRDIQKIYQKMRIMEFIKKYPIMRECLLVILDLSKKINKEMEDDNIEIIIYDIKYFELITRLLSNKTDECKKYIEYRLINYYGKYTDSKLDQIKHDFFSDFINGKKIREEQKIETFNFLDKIIGKVFHNLYLENNFTKEKKEIINDMCENIRTEFRFTIKRNSWLDIQTKKNIIKKLDNIQFVIGSHKTNFQVDWIYKYLKEYIEHKINLIELITKINKYEFYDSLSYLNSYQYDKLSMYCYESNAYYSPVRNEVIITAGILNEPIYYYPKTIDDVIKNYSKIGMIISHEIIHGFDDKGMKFNFEGKIDNNYWTQQSKNEYYKLVDNIKTKLSKEIVTIENNNYTFEPELVIGEYIADLEGCYLSFNTLTSNYSLNKKHIKLFFESYAKLWRRKIQNKYLINKLLNDPHPVSKLRINIIQNYQEFLNTYDIPKTLQNYCQLEKLNIF